MNITLIEPKSPGKHVFSAVTMPRLGLPILGTCLKREGHDVKFIYQARHEIKLSDIDWADLVAISTTTSTACEAYHLGDYARSLGKTVVMGGPHATFLPEEALLHCDYVSRGEGDLTFAALVRCLEQGRLPEEVPGISYRSGGQIIHNPLPDWVQMDQVPYPDFSLYGNLKMSTYPVMTSRGCPFDCTFCSVTSMFGRHFRYRSPESILEELEQYTGKQVFFIDDNFTANPRRAKELLRAMLERKVCPKWWCAQVRTDAARDEELLRLMYQAGCRMVFVGLESINPATLASYNKKQDVEDIEYCIRQFHRYGMLVHGMFVFGADEDTVQTIEDTLSFALKNKIDTVQFMILTPLPGTRTFEELEAQGRIFTHDWNLYDAHHVVYEPRLMSAEELQTQTVQAFKRFYSPANILKNVFVTGWRSAGFRAVGYWLIRSWASENRWYDKFLSAPASALAGSGFGQRISQSIKRIRLRKLAYVTTDRLLDIEVSQGEEGFMIDLTGRMDDFSLKQTFATLYSYIPRFYQNLTINLEGVSFASEQVTLRFIDNLNRLSRSARQIQVKLSPGDHTISEIVKRYNLRIPGFSLCS